MLHSRHGRRERACAWTGLAGSALLAFAATVAGALPRTHWGPGWLATAAGVPWVTRAGVAAAYLGLTLLVLAWLGLGPAVREGRVAVPALLRLLAAWTVPLLVVPPLYSRDVYSYLVQGAMFRDGIDPYRFGAVAYGGELAANVSAFWQSSTAPYGPVFLVLAAGVMSLAGEHVVLGVLLMRLVAVLAVAGTVPLVLALARRYQVPPASALWLGVLNPLFLVHFVAGAHNDALIVVLLLAALLLAARDRPVLAIVIISVAVLVKASALVALAFVVPAAGRRVRAAVGGRHVMGWGVLVVGTVSVTTMSLITAALDAWYGWAAALRDTTRVRNGLSLSTDVGMGLEWLLGDGTHPLPVDPVEVTRAVGLLVAGALVLRILTCTRGRPLYGLGLALTAVVALGPVVHPWYLLWGFVPLAAATSSPRVVRAVALASAAMAAYPMPSGGGPTVDVFFGLAGVAAGVLIHRAVDARALTPRALPAGPVPTPVLAP